MDYNDKNGGPDPDAADGLLEPIKRNKKIKHGDESDTDFQADDSVGDDDLPEEGEDAMELDRDDIALGTDGGAKRDAGRNKLGKSSGQQTDSPNASTHSPAFNKKHGIKGKDSVLSTPGQSPPKSGRKQSTSKKPKQTLPTLPKFPMGVTKRLSDVGKKLPGKPLVKRTTKPKGEGKLGPEKKKKVAAEFNTPATVKPTIIPEVPVTIDLTQDDGDVDAFHSAPEEMDVMEPSAQPLSALPPTHEAQAPAQQS